MAAGDAQEMVGEGLLLRRQWDTKEQGLASCPCVSCITKKSGGSRRRSSRREREAEGCGGGHWGTWGGPPEAVMSD